MRYLRDYKLFESRDGLTDEQRKFLNEYTRVTWSVNKEGLVDVQGDFYCFSQGLEDFLGIVDPTSLINSPPLNIF